MKSSYTKRALAFWLAVAMVATSAPMAFAREPDSVPPASTTTSGTTVTAAELSASENAENAGKFDALKVGQTLESVQVRDLVTVQNNEGTLKYTVSGLPAGLTVTNDASETASISGVPTGVASGNFTVKVEDSKTGTANTAEVQISYVVAAAELTSADITLEKETYDYTGEKIQPKVTSVTLNGKPLAETTDYTVSYGDNLAAGEGTVTIKGQTNYSGTAKKKFNIQPVDLKSMSVSSVSVKKDAGVEAVKTALESAIQATGIKDETVNGTVEITEATRTGDLPVAMSLSVADFTTTGGKYTVKGTFTPDSGNYKAKTFETTCDVTGITDVKLTFNGVSSSKKEVTYGSQKFTEVATPSGATDGKYGEVTYTSSKPEIAAVDSKTGEVTIKSAGTTTITANMQGTQTTTAASASYTLTVNKATYENVAVEDSVFANQAKSYTFDLPQEVRELAGVTYGEVVKDGDLISAASIANQKLSVTVTSQNADASGTVTIPVSSTNYEKFNLVYKLKAVSKTDVSSKITFADKTEYYTGKTIQLSTPSISGISASGTAKWTYTWSKDGVQTTSSGSETMPSFTEVGTYRVTATYEDDANLGRKTATLTIKPAAVKSTITVTATQMSSSKDDNYKYWDLDERDSGDGYLNLRADADDYLVNQKKDGTSSEWIGMTIEPKVGSSRTTDGLWVAFSKTGTWYKLKDISSKRNGDLYITDVDSDSFDLWFDTDDRDRTDSIYLATNSAGTENLFELEVDFDSYSGSSSSSSGSSSSDTSKVDGDRVSTTTVDKTPSVKNGSATVTFSSSALSDALDENKKEAKREDADKTYIELDVKTSKSVDDTTITVPRSSLDKLADEDTGLKLTTNQGTVTFDYRALAEIYDACDKTNIEFYLEEEDDDQYVLLIKDGSSDVIDLGRGSVEVTFDYKLKSGEKSSDVKVYRIGNGDKTWLSTYGGSTVYGAADVYAAAPTYVTDMKADYSSSKKKVTFTTDALGTFLITTDTLKTGSGSTTTTPTYNAFVDVPSSRWSATYINKLASLGIINGTGGGYFEPTLYVTREEFVKMLAGVAGANVNGYTSSRFPDVSLSRWSAPYIAWAADRGITTGTDGGNFAPTMRITREEMATMIYRYVQSAGKTLPAKNAPVIFADANLISGWAQTPVSVMQQAGIIDGNVTNGRYTFDPKVSASREECAKMLAVLYDLVR